AVRLAGCLGQLGAAHPALATWFRKGRTKAAASGNPVSTSVDSLESMLKAGRNRTDFGGHVIPELGFRVSLWNKSPEPASFSAHCGANPETNSIKNSFLLKLPEPSESTAGLYDPHTARGLFRAVVEAWRPEWATFTSHSMREAHENPPGQLVGGWLTYLSGTPGTLATRDSRLSFERFAGGDLIITGTSPLHVSEAQLSAVNTLLAALEPDT
ncbi:Imm52 family immunity protein, partial [Frankia sp. CpI1-P]